MTRKEPLAMHPSRTVGANWQRRGGKVGPKPVSRTKCPLFSDGKHRIVVTPAGVRTKCLCGAVR